MKRALVLAVVLACSHKSVKTVDVAEQVKSVEDAKAEQKTSTFATVETVKAPETVVIETTETIAATPSAPARVLHRVETISRGRVDTVATVKTASVATESAQKTVAATVEVHAKEVVKSATGCSVGLCVWGLLALAVVALVLHFWSKLRALFPL